MSQAIITVDQEKCVQDRLCVAECPLGLLVMDKESGFPKPLSQAVAEVCIDCGHCVAICPTGALDQRAMHSEDCPETRPKLKLTGEQLEHFLRSRRSIRQYKSDQLDRADIQRVIELARYAPSGHNTQPLEWKVISGPDNIRNLGALVVDWMRWMLDNQREIALSFHMDQVIKYWEGGIDRILRNAPHVLLAHAPKTDGTALAAAYGAISYLELAASAMGLGSCWAGYFYRAATVFPPMQEALALPEGHICYGAVMLGRPKVKYQRLPLRKEPVISWVG